MSKENGNQGKRSNRLFVILGGGILALICICVTIGAVIFLSTDDERAITEAARTTALPACREHTGIRCEYEETVSVATLPAENAPGNAIADYCVVSKVTASGFETYYVTMLIAFYSDDSYDANVASITEESYLSGC